MAVTVRAKGIRGMVSQQMEGGMSEGPRMAKGRGAVGSRVEDTAPIYSLQNASGGFLARSGRPSFFAVGGGEGGGYGRGREHTQHLERDSRNYE